MIIAKIGRYAFQEFVDRVKDFHGFAAPGVVLGGVMVDAALQKLPPRILYDALCETDKCLPDAVQLLTPCTIGNGWLKIKSWGRFALTLYDKQSGEGLRVRVHPETVDHWPEIKAWYYKLRPKEETDPERLLESIAGGGYDLCQVSEIRVHPNWLRREARGQRVLCPGCAEAFPNNGPGLCPACRGEARRVYAENNR